MDTEKQKRYAAIATPQHSKDENRKLLTTFPEEIWCLILSNVNTGRTYYQISAAAGFFKDRLHSLRTEVLFPDVVKALFRVYLENGNQWVLNHSKLIPLRQVCHLWMFGVGKFLQSLDIYYQFNNELGKKEYLHFDRDFGNYPTVFNSVDKVDNFRKHFEHTHQSSNRNPFITRYIKICFSGKTEMEMQCDEMMNVLRDYGTHVWYCDIFAEPIQYYKRLIPILKLMPNLKVVKLFSCPDYTRKFYAELEDFFKENPMPAFKKLRMVGEVRTPVSVLKSLLEQNPSVCRLETSGYVPGKKNIQVCLNAANLTSLSVTLQNTVQLSYITKADINCALTSLQVHLSDLNSPWSSFFQMLEKNFSSTLRELKIGTRCTRDMDSSASLHLPLLKSLYLKLDKPQPLDFLLPMKHNLRELIVNAPDIDALEGRSRKRKIMFYPCVQDLIRSNIWRKMDGLQKVEYHGKDGRKRSCTRRQYEKQCY